MAKRLPPEHSRFKKGQSGNPAGRPKLSPDLVTIKELTAEELRRMISKYARMTRAELQDAVSDPMTPSIELMMASGIMAGIKTGDYSKVAFLLDRTIGKVPGDVQEINLNISQMPNRELIELGRKAITVLETIPETIDIETKDEETV